jgi:hypothetical protein
MADASAPVTVPLLIEHDRPFAEFTLIFPDGRRRPTWFWLDTGSGGIGLARDLARELGLPLDAEEELLLDWDGRELPSLAIGDAPLDLHQMVTEVARAESRGSLPGGIPAEGMLGSWVFSRYRCVFDYLERRFSVAPRGDRRGAGVPLPIQVHPRTRFPMVPSTWMRWRIGTRVPRSRTSGRETGCWRWTVSPSPVCGSGRSSTSSAASRARHMRSCCSGAATRLHAGCRCCGCSDGPRGLRDGPKSLDR